MLRQLSYAIKNQLKAPKDLGRKITNALNSLCQQNHSNNNNEPIHYRFFPCMEPLILMP